MLLKMTASDRGSRPESCSGPSEPQTDSDLSVTHQQNPEPGVRAAFLTEEGEGLPGVGDSVCEHQTVSSLQNVPDQTPNRTVEHLPLTGVRTEHLGRTDSGSERFT